MSEVPEVVRTFLSSWSDRDAGRVRTVVTDDVVVRDPNNDVRGPEPLVEHLEVVLRRLR